MAHPGPALHLSKATTTCTIGVGVMGKDVRVFDPDLSNLPQELGLSRKDRDDSRPPT